MPPPARGHYHVATISNDGRFWEVHLELEETGLHADVFRGRLVFTAADGEADAVRTALIFVESSPEAARARARELENHQLVGLLRSCLPE